MAKDKGKTYKSKYFGDGEDDFSETEWEKKLWVLVREAYAKEIKKDPNFVAPDWVTIVDCEEELRNSGAVQTFRQFGKVVKN